MSVGYCSSRRMAKKFKWLTWSTSATTDPIGSFMRAYGVKILYFLYLASFFTLYHYFFVEHYPEIEMAPDYGWFKTTWIWSLRVFGILLLIPSLPFVWVYLFAKLPPINSRPNGYQPPQLLEDIKKSRKGKRQLECLIIRIITRGNYPQMIKKNVNYHVKLIERYCQCDNFEVHIVTERPLRGEYQQGHTAKIKEIVVPHNYKAPNGTLYKARNLVYWMENCPVGASSVSKENTWIIALDEDTFLSESFMADFLDNFLSSGAHCGVSPSLIYLHPSAGFLNAVEESGYLPIQNTGVFLECGVMKQTPLWFCGVANVVRRDVEEAIGYQYPSELSVLEDHVFGNYFADGGFKIGFINGWHWEQSALGVPQLIKQRAYWFRGLYYALLYQNISWNRRVSLAVKLSFIYFILSPIMVIGVGSTFMWCADVAPFPAGPSLFPWDYLTPFAFSNFFFIVVFGAWHNLPTRKAILVTICIFCWFGNVASMSMLLAEVAWALYTFILELYHGDRRREETEKIK